MSSKRFHILLILLFSLSVLLIGGEHDAVYSSVVRLIEQDTTAQTASIQVKMNDDERSSRRTLALVYSCVLPGSGQTMLGHSYKGVGLTLLAFGSALTAVISHNNYIARNERLDALEFQYLNATTWLSAEYAYLSMRATQTQLKTDKNRRDLFIVLTAAIWVGNIVDVLYNSEDQGQTLFSEQNNSPIQLGPAISSNTLFTLSIPF